MSVNPVCLLVDDAPAILELMTTTLERMDLVCVTAKSYKEALLCLQQNSFDLCLTDMKLSDEDDGIELVKYIQENYTNTPVAVITAFGSAESAVKALKAGAFDYLSKPVDLEQLRNLVRTGLALSMPRENKTASLIGETAVIEKMREKIEKLARNQAPVHIWGESGVGKEVVARLIHSMGTRAEQPFVAVNCGAIPADLMESEFFGHKKGSFTGAHTDKEGLFKTANRGTLFLDEVADLPLDMQVKLLRVIQFKQIRPIGANKEIPVDVRILSATHQDLAKLVKAGKFRQDLFYRINVIDLFVPPLRERKDDIPLLIEHILKRLRHNLTLDNLSAGALEKLRQYHFPGNVRELENILERAIALCDDKRIEAKDLQLSHFIKEEVNSVDKVELKVVNPPHKVDKDSLNIAKETPNIVKETPATKITAAKVTEHLDPLLEQIEKERIENALKQTRGNVTKAAKLLGIGFGALRHRLNKLRKNK